MYEYQILKISEYSDEQENKYIQFQIEIDFVFFEGQSNEIKMSCTLNKLFNESANGDFDTFSEREAEREVSEMYQIYLAYFNSNS
jgi:hypothetical protein